MAQTRSPKCRTSSPVAGRSRKAGKPPEGPLQARKPRPEARNKPQTPYLVARISPLVQLRKAPQQAQNPAYAGTVWGIPSSCFGFVSYFDIFRFGPPALAVYPTYAVYNPTGRCVNAWKRESGEPASRRCVTSDER